MIFNDYVNLRLCDTMSKLGEFCRMNGIANECSYNPYETTVTLSRDGDSITKTIPAHRAHGDELINQTKRMITYLLGGEPLIKPDQVLVAARGNGKSQFVCEYFKALSGYKDLAIENVIFNDPATIVFWSDGSKTVVKAENEPFDPEKGLAMAMSKKFLGNKGNYFNVFKKWLPDIHRYTFTVTSGELKEALELYYKTKHDEQLEKVKDVVKDVEPKKPKFKVGDRVRSVCNPTNVGEITYIFTDGTAQICLEESGRHIVDVLSAYKLVPEDETEEIKKVCSNCKHVKPFSNPICDRCISADKFEAKEEKDG